MLKREEKPVIPSIRWLFWEPDYRPDNRPRNETGFDLLQEALSLLPKEKMRVLNFWFLALTMADL